MPRPERVLDPTDGPVPRLAAGLRELRRQAGNPGYRELARRSGYSATTLSEAAGGRRLPALPVVRAYASACGADPAEWEERWRAAAEEVASTRNGTASALTDRPPYPGLASFQTADADLFFGRDQLVGELVARLAAHPFLAVVGASGSGKSSLLRAGLVPAIDQLGPPPAGSTGPQRHGGDEPAARPGTALTPAEPGTGDSGPALVDTPPWTVFTPGERPLDEYRSRFDAGRTARLIVVDQFEEMFTQCRDEQQRAGFVTALLGAATRPGTAVVIALRADFYGYCARYPHLVAALRDGTALIGPMTGDELRHAVTGPAAVAGLGVERALVTKVLAEAAGHPGALPLVSHALLETWRRRQGTVLTLAGYEATGGLAGAVGQSAEQVYRGLDPGQRIVARQILLRLTAPGDGTADTRRRVPRTELALADADEVVDRLARARLVVVDDDTVEITHEALIAAWPRLRDWLTEDRTGLRVQRQLGEAAGIWQALGRESGALYRGTRLAVARDWLDRQDRDTALTPIERDFLTASVAAELHEQRTAARRAWQLRALTGCLAVISLVAGTVGGVALWQWREAVGQRQQALSRQLASQAQAAAPSDVGTAARLAVDAYRAAPTVEARGALLSLAGWRPYAGRLSHGALVKDVVFSPDGNWLASAAQDGLVTIWDHRNHRRNRVLEPGGGPVRTLAYHPAGVLLASAGVDGTVSVWDTTRAVRVLRLTGHRGAVDSVAFSPDGTLLVAIGEDHRIRLWRISDGKPVGTLTGHGGKASDVSFSPDGRRLVSAGDDGQAVIWDLSRKTRVRVLVAGREPMYAAVFSPDGRRIATAGVDRDVLVWDASTGTRLATLRGHSASVRSLAFSADGQTLASAGYDMTVSVWDVPRQERLARLTGHTSAVYGVAVSPDGGTIASASRDETVLLWDRRQQPLTGHVDEVFTVAAAPDGRSVLSSAGDSTALLWDTTERRPMAALGSGPDDASPPVPGTRPVDVTQAAFSRDGRLATAGDTHVRLWDATTGAPLARLSGHTNRVSTVAWHPDGQRLVSAGLDRTVRVWDAGSKVQLTVIDQPQPVERVRFSADGRTLVVAGEGGTVTLVDVPGWTVRARWETGAGLADVDLTPDGRLLAVGNSSGRITLWDVQRATGTDDQAARVGDQSVAVGDRAIQVGQLTGHAGPVTAVEFSPDGQLLASASQDGTVRLWSVPDRRTWATLSGHGAGVTCLAWSPTGDVLYSGGVDHTVVPWSVREQDAIRLLARW